MLSRRGARPSCCLNHPRKTEGAGKAGCRSTRSLACKVNKAHEHSHHRFAGLTRPSLRNGFNDLFRALPGDRALLPPSPADLSSANLTPASGRQDHTPSPSADQALSSLAPPASTASRPALMTLRNAPLWVRTARLSELICFRREAKYFCKGRWTSHTCKAIDAELICPSGKSIGRPLD
jgi:hypothetical protein